MKSDSTDSYRDTDLIIPNQTLGIFLISLLGLFLEILFIRWIGTEIRIFAYLQNTILVACFLGLGLGMFTSSKPINLTQTLVPLAILLSFMAIPITRSIFGRISEMLSTLGDFVIWSGLASGNRTETVILVLSGLTLTYVVLVLVVDTFIPIGRIVGRLINANPNPIWAYSVNIFGSILGTWSFVLLSFLYQPPFIWFLLSGIGLLVFIYWSRHNRRINVFLLATIIILSAFAGRVPGAKQIIWSPYQKLTVRESRSSEIGKYQVDVNNITYQEILDLRQEYISANPQTYPPELNGLSQYDLPLLLHPHPDSMLIVGSGSGNDVAGALRHDVASITAVEIDPAIIIIGRELHPENPYASSRVRVVNDDARSFFATTQERYDIIAFGLLDSHTTTSMTNARLDHYVYTLESLAQAKSILKDGGVVTLNFYAQRSFIIDRIRSSLEVIFGQPPLIFLIEQSAYGRGGVMFVTGDMQTILDQLGENERLAEYIQNQQLKYPLPPPGTTRIATDDWPYMYLEFPKIPLLYWLLIGLMSVIFIRSYRKWQVAGDFDISSSTFQHFFFLGAAFLLLEVQNISKASVVLGNTWEVNAVIITSILVMALLANWVAYKFPNLPIRAVYLFLVGTCLGLYFLDLARFGFLPYGTKAILVGFFTSLPMLFSGIVFIRSFTAVREKHNALGANLLGALFGALMQSITFITGIRALLLLVAAFYVLSLITSPDRLLHKKYYSQ